MQVRHVQRSDLERLEVALPTGLALHDVFDSMDSAGDIHYFLAEDGDVILGSGLVVWAGDREPSIRAVLPDCPEIGNLSVIEAARGGGVGTAMIRYAEAQIIDAGLLRACVGVAQDNLGAMRLYRRLDYLDIGLSIVATNDFPDRGAIRTVTERVKVLVKGLRSV